MKSLCKLLLCKQILGHVLYISCTIYFSPFTRAADNPHRPIFATTRKKFQQITRSQKQKKIVDSHKVPSLFLLTWYPIACTCTLLPSPFHWEWYHLSRSTESKKSLETGKYLVKFPHSSILNYAFSSWIEKIMTKTIHCHCENILFLQ